MLLVFGNAGELLRPVHYGLMHQSLGASVCGLAKKTDKIYADEHDSEK